MDKPPKNSEGWVMREVGKGKNVELPPSLVALWDALRGKVAWHLYDLPAEGSETTDGILLWETASWKTDRLLLIRAVYKDLQVAHWSTFGMLNLSSNYGYADETAAALKYLEGEEDGQAERTS